MIERQQDYVLRTVEERGVRHIRLWFSDVLGQLKSVETSPAELEMAFEEGMQFDGSPIDGDPRQVLKRNLERAREKGFTFYASPDMEYFYFKNSDPRQPLEPL